MSKIETLKGLPTPSELRQSVQELASLEQLPGLVAEQVTTALEPLHRMRGDVQRVLEAYDAVTAAQRRALESMAQEISDRATKGMEQKAAALDKTLQGLQGQARALQAATAAAEASARGLQALPKAVTAAAAEAAREMRSSAGLLAHQADRARPRRWLQALALVLAGAVGGAAAAAGQTALSRLLPPGAVQERADAMQMLLERATPQERALMQQIVNRPGR